MRIVRIGEGKSKLTPELRRFVGAQRSLLLQPHRLILPTLRIRILNLDSCPRSKVVFEVLRRQRIGLEERICRRVRGVMGQGGGLGCAAGEEVLADEGEVRWDLANF